ncbi:MAG: peptidylprolyl isomerase [Terracidiphilus sp.]|nr:peptidylprolyl isomerase [Terracidiphilus sp.]
MKLGFSICGVLLLDMVAAGAQVASHAPTVFPQAPAQTQSAPMGKPVVRINGTVLTEADLQREEYAIFPYARQHGGLPKDMEQQIRDGAMKMMVFEELVYQEALRRKMTIAPAKMQRSEAQFRKQFPTPDQFNAFLQSDFHGSHLLLTEKIRRSLLIEAFLKIEVDAKSAVTPAEVRAYYDKNPALFEHPETYTFQSISFLPPNNATPAQLKEGRARAEKALPQAKAAKTSEQFGLLAEKTSDDDYRVMMGQHKPVPASELPPQVKQTLQSMQPGAISGLVQIDNAYVILHLQAHTPAGETKFAEVQANLTKQLHDKKTNQLRSTLDQKLKKDAKIQML